MINESHEGIMKMPWCTFMAYVKDISDEGQEAVQRKDSIDFQRRARRQLGMKPLNG